MNEGPSNSRHSPLDDPLAELRLWGEEVARVHGAWVYEQFRRDAIPHQTGGVLDVLIAKEVEFSGLDVRRWQATQSTGPGGSSVRRHAVGAEPVTQEMLPRFGTGRPVPDADVKDFVTRRRQKAIVEHGVDQCLERNLRPTPIASGESDRGGQAAAGAGAEHCDPSGIDTEP